MNTQTIGDAFAQAARLSPEQAAELVQSAQNAFVDGFRLVAITGATLLLIAAITTASVLPKGREG
jgi:hypothetical protein